MIPADVNQVTLRRLTDEVRAAIKSPLAFAVAIRVSPGHVYKALADSRKNQTTFAVIAKWVGWEPDPRIDGMYRRIPL